MLVPFNNRCPEREIFRLYFFDHLLQYGRTCKNHMLFRSKLHLQMQARSALFKFGADNLEFQHLYLAVQHL
jgi:hypothetical protein